MIAQSQEAATNFIKPGGELLIPNSEAKKRGFEYVITPPLGEAAVVAILSDRRVQIIDLPDSALKQRTETERLNVDLEGGLKGKGLVFNRPDKAQFRDALTKAGFYADWKQKYGNEAWAVLEKYSGKLA